MFFHNFHFDTDYFNNFEIPKNRAYKITIKKIVEIIFLIIKIPTKRIIRDITIENSMVLKFILCLYSLILS